MWLSEILPKQTNVVRADYLFSGPSTFDFCSSFIATLQKVPPHLYAFQCAKKLHFFWVGVYRIRTCDHRVN